VLVADWKEETKETNPLQYDLREHRIAISDGAKYLATQINQAKNQRDEIVKKLEVGPELTKLINDAETHLHEIKDKFNLNDKFDLIE